MKKNNLLNTLLATTTFTSILASSFPQVALSAASYVDACREGNNAIITYNLDGVEDTIIGYPRTGNNQHKGKVRKGNVKDRLKDERYLSNSEANAVKNGIPNIKIADMELCDYGSSSNETAPIDAEVAVTTVQNWNGGFKREITITNNGDSNIDGWNLEFELDNQINNIWNAEVVSQNGSIYVIKNLGYNSTIAPGESKTVGFVAQGSMAEGQFDAFTLNGQVTGFSASETAPETTPEYAHLSDFPFYRASNDPTEFHSVTNGTKTGVYAFQQFANTESSRIDLDTLNARRLDNSKLILNQAIQDAKVYFINEGAGYRNQLQVETTGTTEISGMVFYNVSCSSSEPACIGSWGSISEENALRLGDYINLGNLEAGTQLDFQVVKNGFGNPVSHIWYTDDSKNSDGLQHLMAYSYEGYLILAWEDLNGGGDMDYNDVVFAVYIGEDNLNSIPSPPPANEPPVANDDIMATPYGEPVNIDVLENDSDPENQTITIDSVNDLLSEGTIEIVNNEIVYTPKSGFSGTDTFTYTISDNQDATHTAGVTVTVEEEVIVDYCSTDGSTSSYENIQVFIEAPGVQGLAASDEIFEVNFNDVSGTESFTKENGGVTYSYEGSLNVKNADQWGGADNSKYITNTHGQSDCYRVKVDQDQKFFGFWWSAGDPHNKLTFKNNGVEVATFFTSDLKQFIDSSHVDDSDAYYGNPNRSTGGGHTNEPFAFVHINLEDDVVFDEVVFETTTGNGAKFESDNHTFSAVKQDPDGMPRVTNKEPQAGNDNGQTYVTKSVTVNVLANDVDPDLELNTTDFTTEVLKVTSISNPVDANNPNNTDVGTASFDENGDIVYTAGNKGGTYTIEYTVSDLYGDTDTGTLTIEVINRAPVTGSDTAELYVNQTTSPINVLSNDIDPDITLNETVVIKDLLTITEFDGNPITDGDNDVAGGTAILDENGDIVYTAGNFPGIYTIEYTVVDRGGESSTGTLTLIVRTTAD